MSGHRSAQSILTLIEEIGHATITLVRMVTPITLPTMQIYLLRREMQPLAPIRPGLLLVGLVHPEHRIMVMLSVHCQSNLKIQWQLLKLETDTSS